MMMKGKTLDAEGTPKPIRRDVFNAMSEKLTSGISLADRVREAPLPDPDVKLGRVAGDGRGEATPAYLDAERAGVAAAGLYDVNTDPKTGEKVPVFTMCTASPNEFHGTVYDRAPMALLPSQYEAWLAGGADAVRLVVTHPDATAFKVMLVC